MNPETKRIVGTFSIMLGLMILTLPLSGWRRCSTDTLNIQQECVTESYGVCATSNCSRVTYNGGSCLPFGFGCSLTYTVLPAEQFRGICDPNYSITGICSCRLGPPTSITIGVDSC